MKMNGCPDIGRPDVFNPLQQQQNKEIKEECIAMTENEVKDHMESEIPNIQDNKSDSDSDISFESDDEEEEWKPGPSTEVLFTARHRKTGEEKLFLGLYDTGTSRSLGTEEAIQKIGLRKRPNARIHQYQTAIGSFETDEWATIRSHKLIELSGRRKLSKCRVQVTESLGRYDFIFGRDYMAQYGIDVCFSNKTIQWQGAKMELHNPGYWTKELAEEQINQIGEPDQMDEPITTSQDELLFGELLDSYFEFEDLDNENYLQAILDSKYERQDVHEVSKVQKHLTTEQQKTLEQMLLKHQLLFAGTLGEVPNIEIDVELESDAKPFHCQRPFRTPHIHRRMFRSTTRILYSSQFQTTRASTTRRYKFEEAPR